ncbi:unnamed protein product [Enterobius vermicularis]|uniref:Short chain dehydrogenase n=1 Tax=Enterobius vermicularis TaxID=51028 RepID=A0A0N4VHC4_ENTVE|nr:unnamed protein product [Enterobius vermicularis]
MDAEYRRNKVLLLGKTRVAEASDRRINESRRAYQLRSKYPGISHLLLLRLSATLARDGRPEPSRFSGRIVLVSSVLGRVSLPGAAPYAVSKFAVTAFGDALRLELKPFGVDVIIIEPGFFRTNIVDSQRLGAAVEEVWKRGTKQVQNEYGVEFFKSYKSQLMRWLRRSSKRIDWVVDAMFHAILAKYPRLRYIVGYDAIFKYIPSTFMPTALQDAAIQHFANLERGKLPFPNAVKDK